MYGSVQVERHVSKSCEWVLRGYDNPLIDGCGESEVSREWIKPVIRFGWQFLGSIPNKCQGRKGCNGKRAAGFPCQGRPASYHKKSPLRFMVLPGTPCLRSYSKLCPITDILCLQVVLVFPRSIEANQRQSAFISDFRASSEQFRPSTLQKWMPLRSIQASSG